MEKKFLTEISYLRVIAIFLVVLLHVYNIYVGFNFVETEYAPIYKTIFRIWLGARMPLFLFISGFLFSYLIHKKGKYQHLGLFVWNKVKRLLIPYTVFALLMIFSHNRLDWSNSDKAFSLLWLFLKNGYWHLWFLLTLFLCFIITRPLAYLKHPIFHILVLIGLTYLNLFFKTEIRFGINHLVHLYIFFYWGYVIFRYKVKLKFLFQWKAVIPLFVLWWLMCFIRDYFGIENINLLKVARYIANLSFILFAYVSLFLLVKRGTLKELPIIKSINKYSYGIYIFHVWIITLLFFKGKFFTEWIYMCAEKYSIVFPIVLFVFVSVMSTLLSYLLLKSRVGRFLIG